MKTIKKIYLFAVIASFAFGCHKDDDPITEISIEEEIPVEEVETIPALTAISPESGPKNTEVSISGSDFGTVKSNVAVFVNNVEALVTSVTESEIKTKVPTLALTGPVKVVVNGKELTGPDFTYEFSEAHVSILAGNKDEGGYSDGQGADALFIAFGGITIDKDGNILVSEPSNHTIRKITQEGHVSTFGGPVEGYEDGHITEAKFSWIKDIATDASGNIYVADGNNNKIRKISLEGIVSTLAGSTQGYEDGQGTDAKFFLPDAITVDSSGNVYVAEGSAGSSHSRIRKISPEGLVTTFAGGESGFMDGQGTEARFKTIYGLAIDASENVIVADSGNNRIRKISPSGQVTTIAGSSEGFADGVGVEAKFSLPWGLTIDKLNNIYVADYSNMRIRKIDPDGMVSTLAGNGSYGFDDGEGLNAKIAFPRTVIVDEHYNLFFTQNFVVRKIAMD